MAFAIVGLLAFAAFAVDVGYILLCRAQLQNSADAAAMAGAWALLNEDRLEGDVAMWTVEANARVEAAKYAFDNTVASDNPTVNLNSDNAPTGDIVFGRLNADGSVDPAVSPEDYNAVFVRVERSNDKNGEVSLFFSRIFGRDTTKVWAEATAYFQDGIDGFESDNQNPLTSLLPFTMHIDDWLELEAGNGDDNWTYDEDTGEVESGGDDVQETKLFPETAEGNHITPGNFGTVDIGHDGNSAADLSRQITDGISADDLDYIGGDLQAGDSLSGDTGLSAGIKEELESIIGQERTIPLYDTVAGNGETTQFHIVGFAGIRIVEVNLTGQNKYLTIQPAVVVDGSSIGNDDGSDGYKIYTPVVLVK
jgi:hypothetical protein